MHDSFFDLKESDRVWLNEFTTAEMMMLIRWQVMLEMDAADTLGMTVESLRKGVRCGALPLHFEQKDGMMLFHRREVEALQQTRRHRDT